jgi:hypothetical protein
MEPGVSEYGLIAWKILFNEEYEELPDVNKPENTAYLNAKKKEKLQRLESFLRGVGKPLVDTWEKKIKMDLLAVMSNPEVEKCSCETCLRLRSIKSVFHLLMEAQKIISKEDKPNG